jgi:hypothetical protein
MIIPYGSTSFGGRQATTSPLPDLITISGRVVTNKGIPLSGVRIMLKTTGIGVYIQYTDIDGKYSFLVSRAAYAIIPVASQFWVYTPSFRAVKLNYTGNDFIAIPSNELVPDV